MGPLLLFDIDGTILLTGGAGGRTMERVGQKLFGQQFNVEQINFPGMLDPDIFNEAVRLSGITVTDSDHEVFRGHYIEELARELAATRDRVRVMPGIHSLLDDLRHHDGTTLGLATGNYRDAVPPKLRAADIDPDWFAVGAFGDDASDRPGLVRLAMARESKRRGTPVDPHQVIVIGDTPRDVHGASKNGCRSLAVATGFCSIEQLRDAEPDCAVEDLSDPTPLWDMIGA